ncbi:GTP-binding protein Rheb-like [Pyxicephalus adspersus]|uniref:GTP-binding protein Rheb-like n=1 Tax=Pyxicephalus adspersus TaxID=30357 RepID=UPI003B5ADAE5
MSSAKYRKVVVLGLGGVGKTSLILQFIKGEFIHDYHTSEDKYFTKIFSMDRAEYELCVVDTSSQAEFSFIPPSYLSGVDGYIIVYSVDSLRSFHIASGLHRKLEAKTGKLRMPVVLVGNKKDNPPDRHAISPDEGRAMADMWDAPFMEVSAKDLEESQKVFFKIIEEIDGLNGPCLYHKPQNLKKKNCCIS